jgi:hypothetical protein
MKTILFVLTLLFFNVVNSQVIKIKVTKVVDAITSDSSVVGAINRDDLVETERKVNSYYIFDLTNKTFKLMKRNKVEVDGDIIFDNDGNVFNIIFSSEDHLVGVIVNTNIYDEYVIWYSNIGEMIRICKFKEFEIIKSM